MTTQPIPQQDFQYVKLPDGSFGKFRSDASDDVIKQAIEKDFPGTFQQQAPNPMDAAAARVPWFLRSLVKASPKIVGLATGAAKSAASTGLFVTPGGQEIANLPAVQSRLQPVGGAQRIGAGLEQTGEMMLTGGPLRVGAEALASRAPAFIQKLLTPAARIGAEAINTGANAALHGQDVKSAAIAGAGGQALLGEALPAVAPLLKKSAAKSYEAIINPTRQGTKFDTQKIMPQLLQERPVALTRQGLTARAGAQAEEAGQQIESRVSGMTGQQQTQPVLDSLEKYRQKFQVNGKTLIPEVDTAVDNMKGAIQQLGPSLSYQDAIKARRILDNSVAAAGGYSGKALADSSILATRKAAADSYRSEFAKASPDLAELNGKFHFWRTLEDTLTATNLRKTGQTVPLGQMLETATAAGAGAARHGLMAGGGYAGAMYAVGKFMRSTAWRTTTGMVKAKLAEGLAQGDWKTVMDLATRGVAANAGINASK
jgi:hypothetical protein